MSVKFLSITLSVFILAFIVELARREKLTFKYSFSWILVTVVAIFFACFDSALYSLAAFLGFQLPSNFIFFAVMCGFVFLSLLLTIFLCQQNRRNDKIVQRIGILEQEIKELGKEG